MKLRVIFYFFLLFFSRSRALIKAELVLKAPNYFTTLQKMKPILARYGLQISREGKPDVIFTNRISKEILGRNVPIIVLEDYDFATMSVRNGKYADNPLIKAIFQTYSLRPVELNLGEQFASCYHLGLVNQFAKIGSMQKSNVSSEALAKSHCVACSDKHPIGMRFNNLKKSSVSFKKERPIDVFFVGSLSYSIFDDELSSIYRWHRTAALNAIKRIKGIKRYVQGGRPLSYPDYIKKMKESKIVVSPWGWGEFCYRDFEAMLMGAVLIKPDTGFVKTVPDIYKNNLTYVPCKPDFSDLEEKVHDILNNYDNYIPMRRYARGLILSYDKQRCARDFVNEVRAVLDK